MLGRICLTGSAISQAVGPFVADFNKTHVYNPRWPPHARFHNGQTMSMGVCLALAMLYYTYRPVKAADGNDSILAAAIFGSVYWVSGMSAILYPGSMGIDPEFGAGFPQLPAFIGFLALTWVGYWFETRK